LHHGAGEGGYGDGDGHPFGHGHGDAVYSDDGFGAGGGLLGHHGGSPYGAAGSAGFATTLPISTAQAVVQPSVQSICGQGGCKASGRHSHLGHFAGGCGSCGGQGCSNCLSGHKSHLGGLGSSLHDKLASLAGGLNRPKTSWFLGAGGPVPLTPGYVPYIVATRSPRDFFSFPPMNPNDP
jgi:hypothetical protein